MQRLAVLAKQGEASQEQVRLIGGIELLVRFLGSSSPQIQAAAARALSWSVRRHEPGQEALKRAGGIEPLTKLLLSEDSNVVVEAISAWIRMLRLNKDSQVSFQMCGALDQVCGLLKSANEVVLRNALCAVSWAVRGNRLNQVILIDKAESVARLIALLKHANTDVKVRAAMALAEFADGEDKARNIMREAGVIQLLIRWLLASQDLKLRREGSNLLWALAKKNEQNKNLIRESRGINRLLNLLNFEPDDETRVNAALALRWLAKDNPANISAICTYGGIVVLHKRLSDIDPEVVRMSIQVLVLLLQDNEVNQSSAYMIGVTEKLFVLQRSADLVTQGCAYHLHDMLVDYALRQVSQLPHSVEPIQPQGDVVVVQAQSVLVITEVKPRQKRKPGSKAKPGSKGRLGSKPKRGRCGRVLETAVPLTPAEILARLSARY
jgi:vacuolar protein 8